MVEGGESRGQPGDHIVSQCRKKGEHNSLAEADHIDSLTRGFDDREMDDGGENRDLGEAVLGNFTKRGPPT